jgi:hypothetical protein
MQFQLPMIAQKNEIAMSTTTSASNKVNEKEAKWLFFSKIIGWQLD